MSELITVITPYDDVTDLALGFVDRVGADQLILTSAVPIPEGDWLQFIVALSDETPAFAGVGRCVEVADNGEDEPADTRYELLIDSLRFEEDSQAVFNHLVMVKQSVAQEQDSLMAEGASDSQRAAQIIDVTDSELEVFPKDELDEVLDEQMAGDPFGADQLAEGESFGGEEAASEQSADVEMAGQEVEEEVQPISVHPAAALKRPTKGYVWQPKVTSSYESNPSSGLFQYNGQGIPIPQKPPRPDLDPTLWVKPAPRPGDVVAGVHAGASAVTDGFGADSGEGWEQESVSEAYEKEMVSDGLSSDEFAPAEEAFPQESGTQEISDGDLVNEVEAYEPFPEESGTEEINDADLLVLDDDKSDK